MAARVLLLIAFVTVLLAGCRGGEGGVANREREGRGEPRPFFMGVSSLPTDPTEEAYRTAFKLAGEAGEVVLIQRTPPWADFLPGAKISDRTERLTRLEKDLARKNNLQLFLAIDATEPADRGRLAALPDELRGRDFSDARLRAAFIAYAKYLALNYKPAYLALGVEVDLFFVRRGDAAFRNFQSLYFEAYDAVKEVSPSTLVFPTFQYEDMIGELQTGEPTLPAWSLVNRFEPKLDMLAISTYPGFVYDRVDAVPADHYAQLKNRVAKPIAFVSVGWSSTPRADVQGEGEGEQAAFLSETLAQASALDARLFIWYLSRDTIVTPAASFESLATMGLRTADDRPKSAWSIWRLFAGRPVQR